MVTMLGLRLPRGYVAERYLGHIAISFHGALVDEVAHDIAPRELEARVSRHPDVPAAPVPAALTGPAAQGS